MENRTEIQKECIKLNRLINKNLFRNYFFPNKKDLFTKIFTSIDVIEDTQGAIDEFQNIPDNIIPKRTTLYIYGVLQAMYCQQDGVQHLYQSIFEENKANKEKISINSLFDKFKIDKQIREIRNDIAGHPADRNNGKAFYFIAKGSNTKTKFTYAGYTPEFKTVDVNLRDLINPQEKFVLSVLKNIENGINKRVSNHKQKFNKTNLTIFTDDFDGNIKLMNKGLFNVHFYSGIKGIPKTFFKELEKLVIELKGRYFGNIDFIEYLIDNIKHIISKFIEWIDNDNFLNNKDADILMDSLINYVSEIRGILSEIDEEFKNY